MRKFVTKVTVTGADDRTSIPDLMAIAKDYPFVEFGLLLSRGSRGNTRFPSDKWMREAVDAMAGQNINLAGHLCGAWVKETLMGAFPYEELQSIHPAMLEGNFFNRFQINTHGQKHKFDFLCFAKVLWELSLSNQSVIFQYDNANTQLMDLCEKAGYKNISALFDLSHGAGVLPKEWPYPLAIPCGYAGGLSPKNVVGQLEKLESIVGIFDVWIDAETHLRSQYYNNDSDEQGFTVDYFDLSKVVDLLEAVKPWVVTA